MNSNFWQTMKQKEQLNIGRSTTLRVNHYVKLWETRCYFNGIPDSAILSLEKINRVPSYRAIAICILQNDLRLKGIGFIDDESELIKKLRFDLNESESKQQKLL